MNNNSNVLSVQHLKKSYGSTQALKDTSLVFNPGIYALLGHNGAGKTTLLNILATVLESDQGTISYNGQNIKNDLKKYRSLLGYMPQHQQLIPYLSVESFLYYMGSLKGLNKQEAPKIIEQTLINVNMYQFKDKSLSSLSGGMKQRVLIGQAILNAPSILLLDEPTAGLDPVERRIFRELIAKISKDKIVILATHVISDVEWIANEIIIMKEGVILASSPQETLLKQTRVFESLVPLSELKLQDPQLKVVNQIRLQKQVKTRFISSKTFEHPVSTTLDDVYLDWLG